MEATDRTQRKQTAPRQNEKLSKVNCSECLQPTQNPVADASGAVLCGECAKAYYIACAGCQGLVPQDEARERNGSPYCAGCFQKAIETLAPPAPADEELEALVTEYVSLHSEHKIISDRMEEIKERLKAAAALKQRTDGAVTLRAGEAAVRCSYRSSYKCDEEKVEALADLLGPERFASLFKRKVSFSTIKDNLEEFLADAEDGNDVMRKAVFDAVEKTEGTTLNVLHQKK